MLNTLKFAQLLQQAPRVSSRQDEVFLTLDKLEGEGFYKDDIVSAVQKFAADKIISQCHVKIMNTNKKVKACIFKINRPGLDAYVIQNSQILKETPQLIASDETGHPYCETAKGWGWLKFSPNSDPIKIGKPNSQAFRLLQSLTEPHLGVIKTVDSVFEAIRENVKEKNKSGVYGGTMDNSQKLILIRYAIKELQKDHKLQGKLKFKIDDLKKQIQLEYTG